MKKVAIIENGWGKFISYAWIGGCREYIREKKLDVSLYTFNSFGNFSLDEKYNIGEYNIMNLPKLEDFDGIILELSNIGNPEIKQEIIDRVKASKVPAISLVEEVEDFLYTGIDNYAAMKAMVEHMVEKHGCKQINYVGGPRESIENMQRFKAYQDVLIEHGIPFEECRVFHSSYDISAGERAFDHFYTRGIVPDCFICANDNLAVGLTHRAQMRGFEIPKDFTVSGFDNFDKASYYSPRISTVGFTREEIAYTAMARLQRIWEGDTDYSPEYVPTEAVFQESCGCTSVHGKSRAQYVMDRIFTDEYEITLHNQMMDLKRGLINCDSFKQMAECLPAHLNAMNFEEMYIVMNSDIVDGSAIPGVGEFNNNKYIVKGYPDQMTVLFGVAKEHVLTELSWRPGQLVPGGKCTGVGDAYLFSPLHFRDQEIGYMVLKNCDSLLDSQMLFEVLNVFLESMENLYHRMILNKVNQELSRLYMLDSLTGLYNRMAYTNLAEPMYEECMAKKLPLMAMFIDQDRLKYINDHFGHDIGNAAIHAVSTVIQECCPEDGIAMRYGGDEFVILVPGYAEEDAERMTRQIAEKVKAAEVEIDMDIPVQVSIGYAIARDRNMTLNDCINLADERMYERKKSVKAHRE